jgi:hypothetical protein
MSPVRQAEAMLMNPGKRADVDNVMLHARHIVLKRCVPLEHATVLDDA